MEVKEKDVLENTQPIGLPSNWNLVYGPVILAEKNWQRKVLWTITCCYMVRQPLAVSFVVLSTKLNLLLNWIWRIPIWKSKLCVNIVAKGFPSNPHMMKSLLFTQIKNKWATKCTSKSNLRRHTLIHTDEKPFECQECGRKFKVNEALTWHKLVHTGEKPFGCGQCGFWCQQSVDLTKHYKSPWHGYEESLRIYNYFK